MHLHEHWWNMPVESCMGEGIQYNFIESLGAADSEIDRVLLHLVIIAPAFIFRVY